MKIPRRSLSTKRSCTNHKPAGTKTMSRLKGKRALITGGSSGIGLDTARAFLAEGARVAITGANPDTLAAAREELNSQVLTIRGDAGDVAAQTMIANAVREAFGGLDVLFV